VTSSSPNRTTGLFAVFYECSPEFGMVSSMVLLEFIHKPAIALIRQDRISKIWLDELENKRQNFLVSRIYARLFTRSMPHNGAALWICVDKEASQHSAVSSQQSAISTQPNLTFFSLGSSFLWDFFL
jgi:hypothetical protein